MPVEEPPVEDVAFMSGSEMTTLAAPDWVSMAQTWPLPESAARMVVGLRVARPLRSLEFGTSAVWLIVAGLLGEAKLTRKIVLLAAA